MQITVNLQGLATKSRESREIPQTRKVLKGKATQKRHGPDRTRALAGGRPYFKAGGFMKVRLPLRRGFHVGPTHGKIQAATMNLNPGDKEGGPDNRHRGSDQWLFVIEGTGRAILNGKGRPLRPGTLLLIEKGTAHEIRNTGRSLLKTLNLYNPPAYRKDGEPVKRGKA